MPIQPTPSFTDHAEPILRAAGVDNNTKADLWDMFHGSKDEGELAYMLSSLLVPNTLKQGLVDAKQHSIASRQKPVGDAAEKGFNVLSRLKEMDPQTLALAEKFPKTASALIGLTGKGDETPAAGKPSKAAKTSAKQPAAGKATKTAPQIADLPPIPDGHHRILDSNGGIHDVPMENLDAARQIDPQLQVMNP